MHKSPPVGWWMWDVDGCGCAGVEVLWHSACCLVRPYSVTLSAKGGPKSNFQVQPPFFVSSFSISHMPEIRELQASCYILHCFLTWLLSFEDSSERMVHGIWADASQNEQLAAVKNPTPDNSRICAGLVHKLEPLSTTSRGMGPRSQKKIWPPNKIWNSPSVGGNIKKLILKEIHYDPRNVIMDFTSCWMQVRIECFNKWPYPVLIINLDYFRYNFTHILFLKCSP